MKEESSASALELPRVTEPISAPTPLHNLVEEYNSRAKLGELGACSLLLRDALGYFARYYAAVCVAACRELDCLPGEVAQSWSSTPSVEAALPVLKECLERLKSHNDRIARKLCLVFFEQDGALRSFSYQCLPSDVPQEFSVTAFCMASKDEVVELDHSTLSKAARLLDAWISASFSFFLESEQRLETGAYFGQLEQVVRFEQYTLRTGLTMRVHESRGQAPMPPLVPATPEPLALAGLAVAEESTAPAPAPAAESDPDVPLAARDLPEEAPVAVLPPPPAVAPEALALQAFVLSQQAKQGPTTSPERKVVAESRMDIRLEPLGFVRSPSGKMGYGGFVWINSIDEDPISGVVSATGGTVEITPGFFEGTTNRVVYWVHPDDILSSKEYLKIKVDREERLYALWRLAPPSRFESLSRGRQAGLLVLPGSVGTLYSAWILFATHRGVARELQVSLGENYDRFINGSAPLSLKQAGIGQLDVNIKPQIESALLIFLSVAWLTPVTVAKIYARYPRRDQRPLVLLFVLGCCLPLLVFLALWGTGLTQSAITQHPELAQLDYRRNFAAYLLLNGATSVYVLLSVEGFFHRILNELGRVALSLTAALLAALVILVQVYGTSWFT
jgi:hypothetical protein